MVVMLRHSKHARKGLCPHSLREPQTDTALYIKNIIAYDHF